MGGEGWGGDGGGADLGLRERGSGREDPGPGNDAPHGSRGGGREEAFLLQGTQMWPIIFITLNDQGLACFLLFSKWRLKPRRKSFSPLQAFLKNYVEKPLTPICVT